MFWQSNNLSGCWNFYDYGNDLYKIVQFKRLGNPTSVADSKKEKATEEGGRLAEQENKNNISQLRLDDDVALFEATEKQAPKNEEELDERLSQSISRTRSIIFELAFCNDFDYFCTLTIDSKKHDRNNLNCFVKDFGQFIRDLNKRRSEDKKIKYLIIPELHKKGGWHFHGLFAGLDEKDLKPNKYGFLDWEKYSKKFGFFSCSPLKNKENACRYVSKYITKDIAKMSIPKGAHLYYCSQGLKRKTAICRYNGDICPIADFDFENEYVKIKWLRGGDVVSLL